MAQRLRRGLVAGLLIAVSVLPAAAAASSGPTDIPLEDLVDPLIGSAGRGSCMPGPCLPHASIYPSPDTLAPTPGGYTAGQPVVGFAQLHTQGTGGVPSYGNFLVTPRRGLAVTEAEDASPVTGEVARAYAYHVRLVRDDIAVDIVPARHSALYRFTFNAGDDGYINIDVARKIGGVVALQNGYVRIDAASGTVVGGGRFAKNWNPAPYRVYFAAKVSTPVTAYGTWCGGHIQPGNTTAEAQNESLGAWLRFNTTHDRTVMLKIAVSFTSAARARELLNREIPGWDFDKLRSAAASIWRRELERITFRGVPPDELRQLYTALWHSLIQPRDRTGDVPGFDPHLPLWDDQYTLWDTWQTLFPLLAIIRPDVVRDNVESFINRYHASADGYVASAFIQGHEFRVGQGGNEVDDVIGDACAKGIPGIDWNEAYALLKHDADVAGRTSHYRAAGWVASDERDNYSWRLKSGSGTLAFAYDDYEVAQVARALGHRADYERYLARSRNWRNVWDDQFECEGFRGFVRARAADGTFVLPPPSGTFVLPLSTKWRLQEGYDSAFYEGTWWEYSNNVPHDLPGLTEKMGGRAAFLARLVYAFKRGYINFGNEPSFMLPWLFVRLHRPYLASYWADRFRSTYHGRDLPGDDDSGAMSSMYLFLNAGIYPIAGQDLYCLHGARVPEMVFHLPDGKTFTITAANAGPKNIYVQSATLNGRPLTEPFIHHRDITAGGTLAFVMGPAPSAWGTDGEFDPVAAARQLAATQAP